VTTTDLVTPLNGLRVVELARGLPSAYCAKLFRDAGADVVRVHTGAEAEAEAGTDGAAGSGAEAAPPEPLFAFLDGGKRSVVHRPGDPLLDDLLDWADIVVGDVDHTGALPGGLRPEAVRARHPRCVLATVSAFGARGPWSAHPANDFILQAWTGAIARSGDTELGPVAIGGELSDWASGVTTAVAALGTLMAGGDTAGEHVDVSRLEVAATIYNAFMALAAQFDPHAATRPPSEPYTELPSLVPASDGWVGFATNTAAHFTAFARMVGRPDWAEDPEYSRADRRGFHRAALAPTIEAWAATRTVAEIVALAREHRIPSAPVGNGRDTPTLDHVRARGLFVRHPGKNFVQPVVPYRMSRAATRPAEAASPPGADTERVRAEIRAASPSPTRGVSLAGIRVFDFTGFWAGPYVSQILGWLGADVIKVESVQRPDGTRMSSAYKTAATTPWETAPLFHGTNTGKRAVTVDVTRPEGVALARRLLDACDVLIENFSPRVVERFGLLPDDLERDRPDLIVLRLPAWGLTGPWREQPGFAQNMEQVAGLAWVTGHRDGPPLVPRGPCDPIGGLHACFATLAALFLRHGTGTGQLVEAPLLDAALNVAARQTVDWSARGVLGERNGNRSPRAAPQGIYHCKRADRRIALSIETDAQWRTLTDILGHPAWARPDELADAASRHTHHDRIDAWLTACLVDADHGDLVRRLPARGVPAADLVVPERILENPQFVARGFVQEVEHAVAGRIGIPGFPARWANGAAPVHGRAAPLLGEHNREIFTGLLGVGESELADLRARDVIGHRPLAAPPAGPTVETEPFAGGHPPSDPQPFDPCDPSEPPSGRTP